MENQELRQRFPINLKPEYEQEIKIKQKVSSVNKVRVLRKIPQGSMLACVLLTLVALWTRLYKINLNDHVVWDEAHFGKFAGHYIKRRFYFDVHPPLGKMLNALAGFIAGFNGNYEFESGSKYPDEVKYGVMRVFNGLFGAMVTPLAYWTGIHLKLSNEGAILLAIMTITDIAYCTISRFILLDSMLLFFTCLAIYCLSVFRSYQVASPFSPEWFIWMAASGASLGLVVRYLVINSVLNGSGCSRLH
jgi:dolichyl-phosphate-mannose-protein mannosyltransferase